MLSAAWVASMPTMLVKVASEAVTPAMRSYMRFAWSLFNVAAAPKLAVNSSIEPAQASALSLTRDVAASRPDSFKFGVAIPFFICTSTVVSCDFDVARRYSGDLAESNVSFGRRRLFATCRPSPADPYPGCQFARVFSDVHRVTGVSKFFCECVNRLRTYMERRCHYETNQVQRGRVQDGAKLARAPVQCSTRC